MKRITIVVSLFLSSLCFYGQSLEPTNLCSSGAVFDDGTSSLSISIGQVFYETAEDGLSFLTQGFQQYWVLGICLGDANGDGMVNIVDLISVSSNFGCMDNCVLGDADFNGVVNILDLIAVSSNFGSTCD